MNMTQREKMILAVVGAVVLLFAGDRYVMTPFMEQRAESAKQLAADQDKQQKAVKLFENERQAKTRWTQMMSSGLNANASTAESQMLRSLQAWAQESGLHQQSIKPDRSEQDKQFRKIVFRVTAEGTMDSVAQGSCIASAPRRARRLACPDIQISARKGKY